MHISGANGIRAAQDGRVVIFFYLYFFLIFFYLFRSHLFRLFSFFFALGDTMRGGFTRLASRQG